MGWKWSLAIKTDVWIVNTVLFICQLYTYVTVIKIIQLQLQLQLVNVIFDEINDIYILLSVRAKTFSCFDLMAWPRGGYMIEKQLWLN